MHFDKPAYPCNKHPIKVRICLVLIVKLCPTLWTIACQDPLSVGFFRQDNWSGFPFRSLGDLSHPGTEAASPALAGGFFTIVPLGKYKAMSSNPQSSLCLLLISSHCLCFHCYILALPALNLHMNVGTLLHVWLLLFNIML